MSSSGDRVDGFGSVMRYLQVQSVQNSDFVQRINHEDQSQDSTDDFQRRTLSELTSYPEDQVEHETDYEDDD